MSPDLRAVVIVSADAEWRATRAIFPGARCERSPFGEWFLLPDGVVVLQGGWGKIAAAASAQYALDRWCPSLLVNLGTCGGFGGHVQVGEILLVERTAVYDIREQMGDAEQALAHYAVTLDLSWLPDPPPGRVRRAPLVSADRDLLPSDIPHLARRYAAVAADWESGAIAWVAQRNGARCLILRGVSDLVGREGGEAYGAADVFEARAETIMRELFAQLPAWLEASARSPQV